MIVTDFLLALVFAVCLARLARALAGPGVLAVAALATLLGIALVAASGALLLVCDRYSVTLLLACGAATSLLCWLMVEAAVPAAVAGRSPHRYELPILLGLAIIAIPLASPGYQVMTMGSDAGVYLNHALQLERDGTRFPSLGIAPDQLPSNLRERYLTDNFAAQGGRPVLVEGLKVRPGSTPALEFHALPAWPVLMSVSGRLLGIEHVQSVTVLVLLTLGALVFLVLRTLTANAFVALSGAVAMMLLPVVVYFSRYPTVELVLAMLCVGMVYAFTTGIRHAGIVAGMLFTAYALVHLSSFILLVIACGAAPFVAAVLDPGGRRQLCAFLLASGTGQLFAMLYARAVSPGYTSDLLSLSFGTYRNGLFVIGGLALLAIALAAACYPRRESRMADRFQPWLGAWLLEPRRFSLLSRLAVVGVCALWFYQAYMLGWTHDLVGTVGSESAWGERDRYAAHGFASLQHLSAVNLARSVMTLPLIVLLVYGLLWPTQVHRRGLGARCVFLAALASLGIYSVIVKDVPFNFYGSRYFLPLAVPLVMLAFGTIVAGWARMAGCVAFLLVALAGGYHAYGLVIDPPYQGTIRLQSTLAKRASASDVLFLVGQPPMQRVLLAGLKALSGVPTIFIDTTRLDSDATRKLINAYMGAMHAEQATIVSDQRLGITGPQDRVATASSSIPFEIRYNSYQRQPGTFRYYVGEYVDDYSILVNAQPQWTVGGSLSLPIHRKGDARYVQVRTGGGWLWASNKAGMTPRIELMIDGVPTTMVKQAGSDFVFEIPAQVLGNRNMAIRSNTFVPAEVGINADRRSLGVDIVAIVFLDTPDASPMSQ